MKKVEHLTPVERGEFFAVAGRKLNIDPVIVEKDFWVVWTLSKITEIDELKPYLTFKGGTSLSKAFNLIKRFSEDIDLSIEKSFFKVGDEIEKAESRNKQRAALEGLGVMCSQYVTGDFLNSLKAKIAKSLGGEGWTLEVDLRDPDKQTILFNYPTAIEGYDYIPAAVKIEMGSRSEHWPVTDRALTSYVKEALENEVIEEPVIIKVLDAERTFWEKATILHQYAHIPEGKNMPLRLSRHYYDFYSLLNSEIKASALKALSLLERVASHKSIYFASGWAKYDQARKGTLKLVPPSRIKDTLRKDYSDMANMFFGEVPEWNLILKTILDFENEFNS